MKLRHGDKIQNAQQIAASVRVFTSNYTSTTQPKAKTKPGGWMLPPNEHVKLNVDASFDQDLLEGNTYYVG